VFKVRVIFLFATCSVVGFLGELVIKPKLLHANLHLINYIGEKILFLTRNEYIFTFQMLNFHAIGMIGTYISNTDYFFNKLQLWTKLKKKLFARPM